MIVLARTQREWSTLADFLQEHAGVALSMDLRMMGWVTDSELKIVVGFSGFIGKVCQMHLAMIPGFHFSPKAMLKAAFHYAFKDAKVEMVIGLVNSKNKEAMVYDKNLGFTELYRLPKLHDDGGDIVVLGMTKEQCRYLGPELINEFTQVEGHA